MFQRIVCWRPERTYEVINTQAESAPPDVFMAVHSEYRLTLSTDTTGGGQRTFVTKSPREFLEDFLAPNRRHVQAIVVGETGSGKSHLVHWMQLNIPPREDRVILTIARAGTTLHSILRQLIELLDEDARIQYKQRLAAAPSVTASRTQLQQRIIAGLVNELAGMTDVDEETDYLRQNLQAFLQDTRMQQFHLQKGGIIAELADHISLPVGVEGRDARRRFTEADLHIDDAMTILNDLAIHTRRFLPQLQFGNRKQAAVDVLNSCLDRCITGVMGFTGEALVEMMADIRRHIGSQGKELILLFEDFARAEGLDRALLDALMQEAGQTGLARLRFVIAVTRGYYEQAFLDTHKARVNFLVDMDLTLGNDGVRGDVDLAQFAARYLNALRLEPRELEEWYSETLTGANAPLRNACDDCQWSEQCHAAFAPVRLDRLGEVGTYPFTADGLVNMYDRRGEAGRFNPRKLLNEILKPICDSPRARELEDGAFPDEALLEQMGGRRLDPELEARIRQLHPHEASRIRTVFELWSRKPGRANQLPPGIFEAFSLPVVDLALEPPPPVAPTPTPKREPGTPPESPGPGTPQPTQPTPPQAPAIPAALQRDLTAIQDWANGGVLTQVPTQNLREAVFRAISEYIDWDELKLTKTEFARATSQAPFQNQSINFRNQQTQRRSLPVNLDLPLNDSPDELARTALALRGLLSFDQYHHWNYEGGALHMLALADCLERWSMVVTQQLLRPVDPQSSWDPLASAVEVLSVGAALAGRLSPRASTAQRLDAMFSDWPDPATREAFSDLWKRLYAQIHGDRERLANFVRNRASLAKGGRIGALVDAVRLAPIIERLGEAWTPSTEAPGQAVLDDAYRLVRDRHGSIVKGLLAAVEAERESRLAWLASTQKRMPGGVRKAEAAKAVADLMDAALNEGVAIPTSLRDQFTENLVAFSSAPVDETIAATVKLRDDSAAAELLPLLGSQSDGAVRRATTGFFTVAEALFGVVESVLQSKAAAAGGSGRVAALVQAIDESFGDLEAALARMEGQP